MSSTPRSASLDRSRLRPDCSSCSALCCTALGFQRSADFPVDKPAGSPCGNLDAGFACTVHDALRPRGYVGCTVFECFGAGQAVTQDLYRGVTWRDDPSIAAEQFRVFCITRRLHELLWYLAEVSERTFDPDARAAANALRADIDAALTSVASVLALDVEAVHGAVRDLLVEVSAEVRGGYPSRKPLATDLAGADLRGRDLSGTDLRSATLIGADLRAVDLTDADLLGADLRGARCAGADLSRPLFLTQVQINGMHGDGRTILPDACVRPAHWTGR